VRNSEIEISPGNFGTGVQAHSGGSGPPTLVVDSRIDAPIGVWGVAAPVTVTRSRLTSGTEGVFACNGQATVEDSLIRVTGSGIGLLARGDNQCGSAQASLTARQVTIVGSGVAGSQTGAMAGVGVAGQAPTLDLSLSIVRDVKTAFRAATAASGTATTRVGRAKTHAIGAHAPLS